MIELSRRDYAQMYGPTTGDRVRLGDTSLLIEVEKDLTVYGDEAKFGGGKSLRDGMGQSCTHTDEECLDTVITNALIVDCTGIYKADVGIKDGKISGIGKSGNPHIMDGVTPGMIVGAHCRRGADPDRRRHRQSYPFHFSDAGAHGAVFRHHDHDRRRHRSGRRHERHHLYTGCVPHCTHAAERGRFTD